MKQELEVPKIQNDKNKSVTIIVYPTRFDHCHDLFRGELSKNQVMSITDGRRQKLLSPTKCDYPTPPPAPPPHPNTKKKIHKTNIRT